MQVARQTVTRPNAIARSRTVLARLDGIWIKSEVTPGCDFQDPAVPASVSPLRRVCRNNGIFHQMRVIEELNVRIIQQ